MERKEEIIRAAIALAAENGLGSVSMQQIADRVGIKKPSLYNHFKSKEEIIRAIYAYLREKAKQNSMVQNDLDYGELIKKFTPSELLKFSAANYVNMSTRDEELVMIYKFLYSERTSDPAAASILAEETKRMILATKNLFYALQVHGKMNFNDIDMAAESFALSVHAMIDLQMDLKTAGIPDEPQRLTNYIDWFCNNFGGIEK